MRDPRPFVPVRMYIYMHVCVLESESTHGKWRARQCKSQDRQSQHMGPSMYRERESPTPRTLLQLLRGRLDLLLAREEDQNVAGQRLRDVDLSVEGCTYTWRVGACKCNGITPTPHQSATTQHNTNTRASTCVSTTPNPAHNNTKHNTTPERHVRATPRRRPRPGSPPRAPWYKTPRRCTSGPAR